MNSSRSAQVKIDSSSLLKLIPDSSDFLFDRLNIPGIDNEPVLSLNAPAQRDEEICLFHRTMPTGEACMQRLTVMVSTAMENRSPLPVVRFADGEYEFYKGTLKCNGLYHQAESKSAIKNVLPFHVEALRYVSRQGFLAPLLFPGNTRRAPLFRRLLGKTKGCDQALTFLELLTKNGIRLTTSNYIPFYVIYAYLSSLQFAAAVDGKTVCIVNSDFNERSCTAWFARANSYPRLVHIPISDSYVATRWNSMREQVFDTVPEHPDCFMAGAGVGALQVCADAARRYSVPAIDSGHILNMMNNMENKSQGPRLFTFRR